MKTNLSLLCALLAGLCNSGCVRDRASIFPSGYFMSNGDTISRSIPTKQDGSFDGVAAMQIVSNDFRPLTIIKNTSDLSDKPLLNEYPFKTLVVTPSDFQVTEASGKQYYALDSDFAFAYIAQFAEKVKFQYMLEYNLRGKNPQFWA